MPRRWQTTPRSGDGWSGASRTTAGGIDVVDVSGAIAHVHYRGVGLSRVEDVVRDIASANHARGRSGVVVEQADDEPLAVVGVMTGALVMSSPALTCAPVASVMCRRVLPRRR